MRHQFDDPHYAPPADLTDAEAAAYEEAVLRGVLETIRPGRYGPWLIDAVELEGRRPETAVVYTYRDVTAPERRLVARARIWEGAAEEVGGRMLLDSAPSLGGHIATAFDAGELRPRQAGESPEQADGD